MDPVLEEDSRTWPYLIIADNRIVTKAPTNERAQNAACAWSKGRYPLATVSYFPNCTVSGIWYLGERIG